MPRHRPTGYGRLAYPQDLEEKEMYRPTLVTVARILVIAAYVLPVVLTLISPTGAVWGGSKKH